MDSISDGCTLMLYSCDQWLSDLGRDMAALRACSGHPAIASIFITPASEVGLKIHEDPLDTFVFQLAGKKTWEVFDRPPGWMTKGSLSREQVGDVRLQVTLSEGDALYIPRGCPHVARADSLSMHLSVGIHILTVRALLAALMDRTDLLPLEFDQAIPFATLTSAPWDDLLRPAVGALVRRLSSQTWPEMLGQVVGPRPPVWEPGALERLSFEEGLSSAGVTSRNSLSDPRPSDIRASDQSLRTAAAAAALARMAGDPSASVMSRLVASGSASSL
jgi:ribosomal protein L16 Arg81 hydroxylase